MSLMEYIIGVMLECPHIEVEAPDLHADSVDAEPDSYSVESAPGDPVLKPYLNGDAQKQHLFALTSRKTTFTDGERVANAALYERVSRWMADRTRRRLLPPMGEGRRPMRLEAVDSGYPLEMAQDNNSGLYVMQCRLTYYEKG